MEHFPDVEFDFVISRGGAQYLNDAVRNDALADIIIDESGEFSGEIIEILDYNKEKFARIKLLNIDQSLLVYLKDSKFNVNDKINFSIPEEKIGLLDLDFNVRLI